MPRPAGRRTKTTVRLATARSGKAMDLYARSLRKAPPDLTTLAKRHGGTFPEEYVTNVLRFGFRFSAHGSSEMPVWGPIFQYEEHYNEADRKSTRLNSSHGYISYAVFCLKKKKPA